MNLYKTANLLVAAAGSKSTFGKGFAKLRDKFIYTIFFIMEQQQAAIHLWKRWSQIISFWQQ